MRATHSSNNKKTIHFIRHGEAEHNVVAALSKEAGDSDAEKRKKISDAKLEDAPLTAKGEEQARALQERAQALGVELVVVSPLTRTLQTAALAFESVPDVVPRIVLQDARERMSTLRSERRSDLRLIGPRFPTFDFKLLEEEDSMWKGTWEYQSALFARACRLLETLAARPERSIAVVTHSAFLRHGILHKDNKKVSYCGELTDRNFEHCELRSFQLDLEQDEGMEFSLTEVDSFDATHSSGAAEGLRGHTQLEQQPVSMQLIDVDTLVFDIDDTLYPESNGFSAHRNGESVEQFMVQRLGFATRAEAKKLRDEYFERYHSTLKALTMADEDGRLPAGHHFPQESLGEWWAEKCDFDKYLKPDPELIEALNSLPLKKVVFTNAPRKYGLAVLDALQLRGCFQDSHIFGVEDVMPACKPEPAAFQKVLATVGSETSRSVMFEDSLKNIRACKAMGMRTVFVRGASDPLASDAEAIDAVLEKAGDMKRVLPGLWRGQLAAVGGDGGRGGRASRL